MATTSIQWTDRVWNPVTGCDKVSPGCAHCYAEVIAGRFWERQYPPVAYVTCDNAAGCTHADGTCHPVTESRPRTFTDVQTHADRLLEPLSWRKPARVFVNSMSDLFHEDVPFEFIAAVFGVMAVTRRHTYQVLTKRPLRMRDWFAWAATQDPDAWTHCHWEALTRDDADERLHRTDADGGRSRPWPLPNVWLGVSVENQHFADERIPLLLQTPAGVRFISAEPLLSHVDLHPKADRAFKLLFPYYYTGKFDEVATEAAPAAPERRIDLFPNLDWVIVGGESGPGARPFDLAWARSIVEQCKAAGVPVFVKQLGAVPVTQSTCKDDNPRARCKCGPLDVVVTLKDRSGGDMAEWPADLQVRQFPEARA